MRPGRSSRGSPRTWASPWEERDITQSGDDLREYGDMIPVTLIDGVQHDFWRVSEQRLRAALGG